MTRFDGEQIRRRSDKFQTSSFDGIDTIVESCQIPDASSKLIRRGNRSPVSYRTIGRESRLSKLVEAYESPPRSSPKTRMVPKSPQILFDDEHNVTHVENILGEIGANRSVSSGDSPSHCSNESSMQTEDFYHEVMSRLKNNQADSAPGDSNGYGIEEPPPLNRFTVGNESASRGIVRKEACRNDSGSTDNVFGVRSKEDGKSLSPHHNSGFEIRLSPKSDGEDSFAGQHSINAANRNNNRHLHTHVEDEFQNAFDALLTSSQDSIFSASMSPSEQFQDAFYSMRNEESVCASTIAESFISETNYGYDRENYSWEANVSINISGKSRQDVQRIILELQHDLSKVSNDGTVNVSIARSPVRCKVDNGNTTIQTPDATIMFDEVDDTPIPKLKGARCTSSRSCWSDNNKITGMSPKRSIIKQLRKATSRVLGKPSTRNQNQFQELADDKQVLLK